MSDEEDFEEEFDSADDFSASEDEWKPGKDDRSDDDDDDDFVTGGDTSETFNTPDGRKK